jgi:UDP-N-acetylmuramoyl-tripeptide--D-alanyl-D-alanine ligase
VGRLVAEAGVAHLIAVGAAAHAIADGAEASSNWAGHAERVADADAGLAALRGISRPGDVVLVKASRAASLDRVAAAMVDDAPDDPAPDQPAAQQAEEQA